MKILYLIHEFYPAHHGGSEKFILQLAQQVQAQGHQVKIVTYDKHNHQPLPTGSPVKHWPQCIKKILMPILRYAGLLALWRKRTTLTHEPVQCYEEIYEGVPVLGFRAAQLDKTQFHLADPNLTAFAEALLEREAPDLIHAGYLLRTAEFLYAAQRLRIPYIITLTSFWLICPKHTLVNEKRQICAGPRGGAECKIGCPTYPEARIATRYADMQRLLEHAGAIVAPSHYMAQSFQRELNQLRVRYIPYGIDCQRFSANQRIYPTEQPLVFFFGGRLSPEKGIDLLLIAFKRLPSHQIRLHIYGDGASRPMVEKAAQTDSRIYYGKVYTHDQVGELLNQADVVVIPSIWHENLPLIMQEAQACGVPTLVADVGGMTECVSDGVNGFTFRMGDGQDLQRKMQMIIDQPEILNTIKEHIRNPQPGQCRVTSLPQEAAMYLEQYESMLAKPPQVIG